MTTRSRVGAVLLLAGIAVGLSGLRAVTDPASSFYAELVVDVPTDAIEPNQGHAWVAPLDVERAPGSDGTHVSPLVLYEDRTPLERQDNHRAIREEGGGQFSHWGTKVWFATRDGSDPRSNGRRYRAVLPRAELAVWRGPFGGIAAVGWALAAVGLALSFGLARAVLLAATLGGAWLFTDRSERVTWIREFDRMVASARRQADAQSVHLARAVPRTGNVTHLRGLAFTPDEPLPDPAPPLTLALEATGENERGLWRLTRSTGAIVGTPPREIRAADLAEIRVRGVFAAGSRVLVDVQLAARDAPYQVEVPVRASEEVQELRVVRPLGLAGLKTRTDVTSVTLRATSEAPVVCRVDTIELVDASDVHRSTGAGEASFRLGRSQRHASWQGVSGRFRVPLDGADGDLFKIAVALRSADTDARCRFTIEAEDADGRTAVAVDDSVWADGVWRELQFALHEPGPVTALVLRGEPVPDGAVLAWAGARVVDTSRAPRRVVFALMDTLRADMVGTFADDAPPTPHLDALAADGVAFERCISQSYWTRPSMASIMSGRYVQSTGIHTTEQRLPGTYPTIVEAFETAGFYTAAMTANSNAGPDAGLGRGWTELTLEWNTHELTDADEYLSRVVEPRLPALLDEDLFLYVHLMDAHGPYGPADRPEGWTVPPGARVPFTAALDQPWNPEPTDASRVALYRDDVRRLDAGWGAFLERALALWEQGDGPATIVAVASDHGEFLGEYGEWSHGRFAMLPEVVHVPLILRAPGRLPRGARVPQTVRNVDIGPTLLELADVAAPVASGWDGRSLLDAVNGVRAPLDALTSGGPRSSLFAVYSDGGALEIHENLISFVPPLVEPRGRDRHDSGGSSRDAGDDGDDGTATALAAPARDADLPDADVLMFVERPFHDAWTRYRERGDAIRDALWIDVEPAETVIDAEARRQLDELGYN